MTPLIHLDNVSIRHDEHVVLEQLWTEVNEGELVYLIGKTGSGKSSLLRTLYGDLSLTSGRGSVCGHDLAKLKPRTVHKLRRKLGMVFQDFGLLQDRSVDANLDFALLATGWKDKKAKQRRIEEVLTAVGLPNKGYKMPFELSGGEQQRVAIARALLNDPPLLLADEPTGNLDQKTADRLHADLIQLSRETSQSFIIVTHNPALADQADRVLHLEGGKIVEGGEAVAG